MRLMTLILLLTPSRMLEFIGVHPRASALECSKCMLDTSPRKVVNLQSLKPSNCKYWENLVYSHLLCKAELDEGKRFEGDAEQCR